MSFQVGATCYASASAALAAIASGEGGKVLAAGEVVYAVDAVPSGASSVAYTLTPLDGAPPIGHTVAVALQPCAMIDWPDAVGLSWGIGGVWIVCAALLTLRKAASE